MHRCAKTAALCTNSFLQLCLRDQGSFGSKALTALINAALLQRFHHAELAAALHFEGKQGCLTVEELAHKCGKLITTSFQLNIFGSTASFLHSWFFLVMQRSRGCFDVKLLPASLGIVMVLNHHPVVIIR